MDIDKIIAAWNQYLLGLYASGQIVPLPPGVTSDPVPLASDWTNGMSHPDARGFVKLQAIEAQRTSDPKWAKVCSWYAIKDVLTTFSAILSDAQRLSLEANMAEAAMIANGPMASHEFDGRALFPCSVITASGRPGVQFERGNTYSDALAFPAGFVGSADPTVADLPQFIANCNKTGEIPVYPRNP